MNNLGFGTMRMPLLSDDPTDFDYEQINQMFDAFLDAGYTYFDTSFVYHNGKSENCVRKCLVERYPRDSFTVATKFPSFNNVPEDQIEATFQQQLDNVGVDFFDYYLIHNVQTVLYDGIDGKDGIIKATHLFEHLRRWKEEGRAKNIGFSFHSSAKLLDRILTEHPEVDFVQIAVNPIDWDSEFVQAAKCYEVIRRHGKKIVMMEPIKGGGLSALPEDAEALFKALRPNDTIASWSLRFSLEMGDVIAVLSGMSTLKQVEDNIATTKAAQPLSAKRGRGIVACDGAVSRQHSHHARADRSLPGHPMERRARHSHPASLQHLPDPTGSRLLRRQQLLQERACRDSAPRSFRRVPSSARRASQRRRRNRTR